MTGRKGGLPLKGWMRRMKAKVIGRGWRGRREMVEKGITRTTDDSWTRDFWHALHNVKFTCPCSDRRTASHAMNRMNLMPFS